MNAPAVDFVRLGYGKAGAMTFRVAVSDWETFAGTVDAIGPYNGFDPETVLEALRPYWGELSGAEVGREYSPVVYLELPQWTHQRIAWEGAGMGQPIGPATRRRLARGLLSALERSAADELVISAWDGRSLQDRWAHEASADDLEQSTRIRGWWD